MHTGQTRNARPRLERNRGDAASNRPTAQPQNALARPQPAQEHPAGDRRAEEAAVPRAQREHARERAGRVGRMHGPNRPQPGAELDRVPARLGRQAHQSEHPKARAEPNGRANTCHWTVRAANRAHTHRESPLRVARLSRAAQDAQ